MLVLTRKLEETVLIGDDVEVKILDVRPRPDGGGEVKLGFTAPRQVQIDRGEVRKRRDREPAKGTGDT